MWWALLGSNQCDAGLRGTVCSSRITAEIPCLSGFLGAAHAYALLRAILQTAVDDDIIAADPAIGTPKSHVGSRDVAIPPQRCATSTRRRVATPSSPRTFEAQ